MMEYDFAIVLEHPSWSEDGLMEIIFPESCVLLRERIGEVMGGQILELSSERLREEARQEGWREGWRESWREGWEEGRREGRIHEIYSMVQDGDTTPERAAKRLGITESVLKNEMAAAGYRYPES